MKKHILVVAFHLIKPVEERIDSHYDVRRKTDGTLSSRRVWSSSNIRMRSS
jgi:hypothetical protein